jgi:hypothetical protein
LKKVFFILFFALSATAVFSQTDSLDHYTGKYSFPDGSPVTEISISVDNGTLMASSAMGNSEFKRTDTKDVFEIVAFGGTATFRRAEDNKVNGLVIQVQDITMEGKKSEGFRYYTVLFPAAGVKVFH